MQTVSTAETNVIGFDLSPNGRPCRGELSFSDGILPLTDGKFFHAASKTPRN